MNIEKKKETKNEEKGVLSLRQGGQHQAEVQCGNPSTAKTARPCLDIMGGRGQQHQSPEANLSVAKTAHLDGKKSVKNTQ
jgi:hypothetical protein